MSTELLQLLIKSVDEVKETLSSIDDRLRNVEKTLAESKGRRSGLVTAKDIFCSCVWYRCGGILVYQTYTELDVSRKNVMPDSVRWQSGA